MALIRTPNGLTPLNMQGGAPFNGGAIRQFVHSADVARPFALGALMQLSGGNIVPLAATPTTATRGLIGVCVGLSYIDPAQGQQLFGQYLPANAISAGYQNVRIYVNDDPNQLYKVNTDTVPGTLVGGPRAAIGLNAALTDVADVNAVTGVSEMVLDSGANWGDIDDTNTFAVRVVDVLDESLVDPWPELVVKINFGVHSYTQSAGRG